MTINNQKFVAARYSSGELKLKKQYLNEFISNNTVNIFYNGSEINMFELILIIKYYTSQNTIVNLTLGYLPYQRMNHNNAIDVETLRFVAEVFNSLNLNSIKICEPHCELSLFNNATKIDLVENIFNKTCKITGFDPMKDVIVFTDKGSKEKYGHLGKNHIICSKQRDKQTGLISFYQLSGTIESGKKIIILDDIISSGDTVFSTIEEICKQGNFDIYIVCGHFEKNKFNKRVTNSIFVKQVFSTNSLSKKGNKELTLFNVAEVVNEQQ